MISHEVPVTIKGRTITPSVDGLGPLEVTTIANQVEKRIDEIEARTGIPDSGKLALLAAFGFATELYNLKQKHKDTKEADTRKIDELIALLEGAQDKKLF